MQTDNDWILFMAIVNALFMIAGPSFGFKYPGQVQLSAAQKAAPTIITYLIYVWNAAAFYFSLAFFQVAGGSILSAIFWVFNLICGWVLLKFARGTGG